MPAVAIAAAVVMDGGVIAAGGFAAVSAMTAVAAIGATVSAVGAVTHNKTLSTIGMGMGIVGAVGMMANVGSATNIFGDTIGGSAPLGIGTAATEADTTSNAAAAAANPTAAAASSTAAPASVAAEPATVGGLATNQTLSSVNASLNSPLNPGLINGAPKIIGPTIDSAGITASSVFNPSFTTESSGMMSGLFNWAKDNQVLASGIVKVGGSLIAGMTDPTTTPKINNLNSQTAVNNAQAAMLNRENANFASGVPVVTGTVSNPSGLINTTVKVAQAPKAFAPVTGAVA